MIRFVIVLLICIFPIFSYSFLYYRAVKNAALQYQPKPSFLSKQLLRAFVYCLLLFSVMLVIFVACLVNINANSGQYLPATVIDGRIEKSKVLKQ